MDFLKTCNSSLIYLDFLCSCDFDICLSIVLKCGCYIESVSSLIDLIYDFEYLFQIRYFLKLIIMWKILNRLTLMSLNSSRFFLILLSSLKSISLIHSFFLKLLHLVSCNTNNSLV